MCFVGVINKLEELNKLMLSEDHKAIVHAFTTDNKMKWHFILR